MDHEKKSDRLLIEFSICYNVSLPPIPNFKKQESEAERKVLQIEEESPRNTAPQSKILQIEEESPRIIAPQEKVL